MRKNEQKNSKNISAIVNNLLIFQKYCDKINKSKGYGGYHMLNSLNNVVNFLNSYIWGVGMLILIVGSGLYFTIRLHGFQFVHFKDMWSRIIDKQDSDSGISAFGSFCTTMAMRVGTGNVAGVAVAIYMGGPGALFWMILAGMTRQYVLQNVRCQFFIKQELTDSIVAEELTVRREDLAGRNMVHSWP